MGFETKVPSTRHWSFFEEHVPQDLRKPTQLVRSAEGEAHPILLCTQGPGDSVFTPDRWMHATVNIWPSVAAVTEIGLDESYGNTIMAAEALGCNPEKDVARLYKKYHKAYAR